MENHAVIENDIVVREIWRWAKDAGFKRLELTPMTLLPPRVTLEEYDAFLDGTHSRDETLLQSVRAYAQISRLFFLSKQAIFEPNSRARANLVADLRVVLEQNRPAGDWIQARIDVTNISPATWPPVSSGKGAVFAGCHLRDCETGEVPADYARSALTSGPGNAIKPGETVSVDFFLPIPAAGSYELIFDLVSEGVCWFEENGSRVVKLRVQNT